MMHDARDRGTRLGYYDGYGGFELDEYWWFHWKKEAREAYRDGFRQGRKFREEGSRQPAIVAKEA